MPLAPRWPGDRWPAGRTDRQAHLQRQQRACPLARAQATNASTKTSAADIAASVLVFALAFGVGTYQLWGGSSP